MKFTVERAAIKAALATASMPVQNRNTIPVLGCVLLTATDTGLRITGSNMDIEAQGKCDAVVTVAGRAAVNCPGLIAAVNASAAGALINIEVSEVTANGSKMTLTAGKFRATFQCLPADDFPVMAVPDADCEIVGVQSALAFCAPFVSTEETRYYLCGVYVSNGFAVATDGHRLSVMPCDTGAADAIIPSAAVQHILKGVGPHGRIWVGRTGWRAEAEGIAMAGKLVDGSFPDWTRIIPKGNTAMTCDCDALTAAVAAASLNDARNTRLTCDGETLTVAGDGFNTAGLSGGASEIKCDGVAGWTALYNTKYLQAILGQVSGRVVQFSDDASFTLVSSDGFAGRLVIGALRG